MWQLQEIAPFVKVLGCYPASDASVSSPAVETRSAEEVREQLAASTNPVSSANGSEGSNGAFAPDSLLISAAASARPIRQVTEQCMQSLLWQTPIIPHLARCKVSLQCSQ